MLEELRLWNVGGIGQTALSFDRGLTVITGESGAGKSSIVRALELVAGARGQASLIRGGEEEAGAEATFSTALHFPGLEDSLQPEEGALFARRVLPRGDRARAALQGIHVPLGTYAQAMGRLLRIQSQFAQMELLDADRQLSMVDSCIDSEARAAARELRTVFDQARACDRELRGMAERRAEIERQYANAGEVLALVRKVRPEPGLEGALESEIGAINRRLAQQDRARQNLDRLCGGLSEQGLLDELRNIGESLLEILPEEEHSKARHSLTEGVQAFTDVAETVREGLEGHANEAMERDRLESRLGALRRLKRLSGTRTEDELLAYCRDAAESLEWLETSYAQLEDLSQRSRDLKRRASALALVLREGRRTAASALEARVNALLADLGMEGIEFSVVLKELTKLRRSGADEAEFLLSAGKRSGRVDKIASGGELSRLLLALQLSLPDEWLPPSLVFDEVEAGLGGRAAVLSGVKLKALSRRCQVVLVTHEASIAALGDVHILVRREGGESQVRRVEGEERVTEIARMLSGTPNLAEARDHARRLLAEREADEALPSR
ncbi:AAA family ATPase [Fretibacterium sp. OH1220_COT-178]|uniref:AAA family ATPase n=1 Tax=Fretibacterium sp. OH1220_COT-178 TaxID=2491047 RepID=UPI000F5DC272|nr:AAA family ATPase [Fretibacterium sp. OH1220_COT-178]RRD64729.1 DNA recombination protein RecN [Fretibacterium sp. OH1220_COT-178]